MLKEIDETDTKQKKQKTKSKGKKDNFRFEGEATIEIYANIKFKILSFST